MEDAVVRVMEGCGSAACGKERKRSSAFGSLGMSREDGGFSARKDSTPSKYNVRTEPLDRDSFGNAEEDDAAAVAAAAAFCEEGVRKKMGVLARMVGMEGCGQPGVVLTEVVRVLKELDGRARGVCSSREN
ncbi:hypothetical protein HPP92_008138 [Vanilla planifolia]|uniref:Uncharacterized protein n=1 Tax=Vanilla planifolia TaxID=51239 RepID=A0A835RNR2_VANPL|nr:hypothetical protein HPP92_008138 [Vanilla planifolia]